MVNSLWALYRMSSIEIFKKFMLYYKYLKVSHENSNALYDMIKKIGMFLSFKRKSELQYFLWNSFWKAHTSVSNLFKPGGFWIRVFHLNFWCNAHYRRCKILVSILTLLPSLVDCKYCLYNFYVSALLHYLTIIV